MKLVTYVNPLDAGEEIIWLWTAVEGRKMGNEIINAKGLNQN